MRKLKDVIGLPVLDVSSGKKVGTVKDVYFNQIGELMGLTVETNGFFNKLNFLSFESIGAIGDDAVTIGTERALSSLNPNTQYYGFSSGKQSFSELPIVTTNGHELGHIKDVYFMEEMGKIIGYEISDGFLTDITEGRRTIQVPHRTIVGEDAMIVPVNDVKDVIFDKE